MSLKPTTCKEAIARWEKGKDEKASEAKVVELQFQWPPIEKMDAALSTLVNCEKLSLSTNMIDKIAGIAGMKRLKILALGRNNIKSLAGIVYVPLLGTGLLSINRRGYGAYSTTLLHCGLVEVFLRLIAGTNGLTCPPKHGIILLFSDNQETVADSLEQLWISYNEIDKLKGIGALKNLQVFYMSNNLVKDWIEINRLQELPKLWDVVLWGNPIYDSLPDVDAVRAEISKRVPQITKLDGIPIIKL